MNKLMIAGHITRDAELRTVKVAGVDTKVCNFTVAANYYRRNADGTRPVQFVRVTAWRDFAEKTAPYLKKGMTVMVAGPVRCNVYKSADGTWRGQLEMTSVDDFEFLSKSKKDEEENDAPVNPADAPAEEAEFPFG